MTPAEFKQVALNGAEEELLALTLSADHTPFVFDSDEAAWAAFKGVFQENVGNTDCELRIVGSGRLGFSLKPANGLRAFRDTSDLDVVAVSPQLFDDLWGRLLHAQYPRDHQANAGFKQRQRDLYTGWICPLDIKFDVRIEGYRMRHVAHIRARWFEAFQSGALLVSKKHEKINGRLYRTWEHARLYHRHSVLALQKSLRNSTREAQI